MASTKGSSARETQSGRVKQTDKASLPPRTAAPRVYTSPTTPVFTEAPPPVRDKAATTAAVRPPRATTTLPPPTRPAVTRPRDAAEPDGTLSPAATAWHAFLLRKAAQRVTALADVVLVPQGLTLRHFGLLLVVADEPGLKQRMVGERLRIDRTTVVSLVDDLENAGLLRRHRGTDRRTFSLYLTTAGTTRLDQLRRMIGEVHQEFLAPLSTAEQAMLHDLLTKLTN